MDGIVIEADGSAYRKTFTEPILDSLQKTVGGYLESVSFQCEPGGNDFIMLVDEEGLIKQLPINLLATMLSSFCGEGNIIVGPAILLKIYYTRDGECLFVGIPKKELEDILSYLRKASVLFGDMYVPQEGENSKCYS